MSATAPAPRSPCPLCEAALPDPAADPCPTCASPLLLAGRLRLVRRLGRGGSSLLVVAHDLARGRDVALKGLELSTVRDWKQVELFERQADLLAHLDHPGLPRVHGLLREERPSGVRLWLEHELVDGTSLDALLTSGRRWDEAGARTLLDGLLDVVAYLHGFSPPILHRDIKPSNVLLRTDATGAERPVLIDFDTATGFTADPFRRDVTLVGTAGFVPMEQLAGQAAPGSDLYALGMTLVAVLSGRAVTDLPLERGRVRFEEAVSVSTRLVAVLRRMTAPSIEDRFASVAEVRAALAEPPPRPAPKPTEAPESGASRMLPTGTGTKAERKRAAAAVADARPGTPGKGLHRVAASDVSPAWRHDRHLVFASGARASTEYGLGWGANRAAGPPRVYPRHGDIPGAWAPKVPNRGGEWLELRYPKGLAPARAIRVFETCGVGAVSRLEAYDAAGQPVRAWSARPADFGARAAVLVATVDPPVVIQKLRIGLDTSQIRGWPQIDAVALELTEPHHPGPVDWGRRRGFRLRWALAGLAVAVAAVALATSGDGPAAEPWAGPTPSAPAPAGPLVPGAVVTTTASSEWLAPPVVTWASSATASSQYGDSSWNAGQAAGPPNVFPSRGDVTSAWASLTADGGWEWLELTFPPAAPITRVAVYETYNPGALARVEDLSDPDAPAVLWQKSGPAAVVAAPGEVWALTLPAPRAITRLRLILDSAATRGWNEIDAVGLLP